jgi:hypothetical protein
MEKQVRRSPLLGDFPAHVVPYGIDTDVFRPIDRSEARARRGLPPHARIVFALADVLESERKGFGFVRSAMEPLLAKQADTLLVTAGQCHGGATVHPQWRHLGPIYDEAMLACRSSVSQVAASRK